MSDNNEIRFEDTKGHTLFTVPDGGRITLTYFDGDQATHPCKYRNEHHAEIGNTMYHIDEFASRMAENGTVYAPEGKTPDIYEIYQIPGVANYLFRSFDEAGEDFQRSDYVRQYAGMLAPETTLAMIYSRHNQAYRPFAQKMRSASMSDVFVLRRGGESQAYYVDTFGFKEVPQFLEDSKAMDYIILAPGVDEKHLYFQLNGEQAERHGAIGYLRGHFGRGGNEFHTSWFDNQRNLKSPAFKAEFDTIINHLRAGLLKNRRGMEGFCSQHDSVFIMDCGVERGAGFKVQTPDYSCFARCTPNSADYDFYVFAYDNNYLLPELAGQHELPQQCYSMKPHHGIRILIERGESGYTPLEDKVMLYEELRQKINGQNAELGVTRAQEEAMLAGSMFGWDVPGARPWNYDMGGRPRVHDEMEPNKKRDDGAR